MFDWILKNPQIIIFLIVFVFMMIGRASAARKAAQKKRETEMRTGRQYPTTSATTSPRLRQPASARGMNIDEAERTRRVQEEIRRKILARMQGNVRAATAPIATRAATYSAPAATPADDPSADAYRNATDEITRLESMAKNAEANKDSAFAQIHEVPADAATAIITGEIQNALRDNGSVRRAFLLSEILGKPKGLS